MCDLTASIFGNLLKKFCNGTWSICDNDQMMCFDMNNDNDNDKLTYLTTRI